MFMNVYHHTTLLSAFMYGTLKAVMIADFWRLAKTVHPVFSVQIFLTRKIIS